MKKLYLAGSWLLFVALFTLPAVAQSSAFDLGPADLVVGSNSGTGASAVGNLSVHHAGLAPPQYSSAKTTATGR